MAFKAGFVNIIGKPNVGKSTLINALLREKVSIVSPKVQTTRHRILAIINGEDHQVIFSDTPGIITQPKYRMHEAMMKFVSEAIEDADVAMYMVDVKEDTTHDHPVLERLMQQSIPVYLILNKIDKLSQDEVVGLMKRWTEVVPEEKIIPVSAIKGFNIEKVMQAALEHLPENPPYYPDDQYTDKTERFLAAEVIREKIFHFYKQEIPYSTEVVVTSFKEADDIIRITAEIIVERDSQKGIIIGKKAESLKKVGTAARKELEEQYGKKVFLDLYVKVRTDWRENKGMLRQFGFDVS